MTYLALANKIDWNVKPIGCSNKHKITPELTIYKTLTILNKISQRYFSPTESEKYLWL